MIVGVNLLLSQLTVPGVSKHDLKGVLLRLSFLLFGLLLPIDDQCLEEEEVPHDELECLAIFVSQYRVVDSYPLHYLHKTKDYLTSVDKEVFQREPLSL